MCKCAVPLIFEHTSLFFWFLLAFCCLYPRPFLLPDSCRTHTAGWPANEDPTIQKLKHRRAAHQFAYHIYIKLHSHIDYITTYIYIYIYYINILGTPHSLFFEKVFQTRPAQLAQLASVLVLARPRPGVTERLMLHLQKYMYISYAHTHIYIYIYIHKCIYV